MTWWMIWMWFYPQFWSGCKNAHFLAVSSSVREPVCCPTGTRTSWSTPRLAAATQPLLCPHPWRGDKRWAERSCHCAHKPRTAVCFLMYWISNCTFPAWRHVVSKMQSGRRTGDQQTTAAGAPGERNSANVKKTKYISTLFSTLWV